MIVNHTWRTIEYLPFFTPEDGPTRTLGWQEPATLWQRIRGQEGVRIEEEVLTFVSAVRQVCDACPKPHLRIVQALEETP